MGGGGRAILDAVNWVAVDIHHLGDTEVAKDCSYVLLERNIFLV